MRGGDSSRRASRKYAKSRAAPAARGAKLLRGANPRSHARAPRSATRASGFATTATTPRSRANRAARRARQPGTSLAHRAPHANTLEACCRWRRCSSPSPTLDAAMMPVRSIMHDLLRCPPSRGEPQCVHDVDSRLTAALVRLPDRRRLRRQGPLRAGPPRSPAPASSSSAAATAAPSRRARATTSGASPAGRRRARAQPPAATAGA